MKQGTRGGGANGFVWIVQGGFKLGNDVPVANIA
jgi:hypothetical protein